MDQSTTHLDLALQAAVRRCMDDVVRQANADAMLLDGAKMEKNQIRNVLNVADESHSLAVVAAFIRYQLGRSNTGRAWQHNGFGLRVIEQIEASQGIVARQAERVLKQAQERVGDISAAKMDDVRYDLARCYLGYLHWAFYYGNETGNWDNLRVPE